MRLAKRESSLHVLLGERRAARGDGAGDAGAGEADDVGVALADDDLAARAGLTISLLCQLSP